MLCLILLAVAASVSAENFDVETYVNKVKRSVQKRDEKMSIRPIWPGPIWPPQPQDYNASSVYNPLTERCCKGKVHEGSQRAPLECCGTEIRDKSTQLCCEGTVHDWKIGFLCCGNNTYNTKEDICCDNQLADLPTGTLVADADCCNQVVYDTKKQLCCYDPRNYTQVTVNKKDENNDQCCGIEPYTVKTHTCCYGNDNGTTLYILVAQEGNKTACCGTKLYDYNTEICCDNVIISHNASNTMLCCGKQAYDYNKQICCYQNQNMTIIDKKSDTDSCCGNKSYNYQTQLCCNNRIIENKNQNLQCCGDVAMNTHEKLCCYGNNGPQRIEKSCKNDDNCCGLEPYNSKKQLCCYYNGTQSIIKKKHPNDNQCCGLKSYQAGKELCCIGQTYYSLYRPPWGGSCYNQQCCGEKSIDTSTSYCCGTTEINYSKQNNLACCGQGYNAVTYNVEKEICCYDYSNPKDTPKAIEKNGFDACCAGKGYNYTQNFQCCKGNLLQPKNSETCCGDKLYNYQSQVCCGDNILEKKDDNSQCCYNFITDEDQECIQRIYPIIIQQILQSVQGQNGGGPIPLTKIGKKKK